jgi:tetratricopeptide (TPR) repeat protein
MKPMLLAGGFALVAALAMAPALAQSTVDKGPGSNTQQQPAPLDAETKVKQEEQEKERQNVETLNKAIEANNKGVELQEAGKNAEAVEQFRQALKINPAYEKARANLAKAHYNLSLDLAKQGLWAEVIENLESARTYDKDLRERTDVPLAQAYNNQASVLVEAAQWDAAVEALGKAAEINPEKYGAELARLKTFVDTQVKSKGKK